MADLEELDAIGIDPVEEKFRERNRQIGETKS